MMDEVKNILMMFAKNKSPGHDGWTVELYPHFFELFGREITEMVDES